jgi:hypothetical protein
MDKQRSTSDKYNFSRNHETVFLFYINWRDCMINIWLFWHFCGRSGRGYLSFYWFVIILFIRLHFLNKTLPLILFTLPEHLSSPPVFSEVRVTRSLVLYVCFVDRCLSLCTFSFGHCVDCSSSIYGFWLPLWYLQTLLNRFISSGILSENHHVTPLSNYINIFYSENVI